MESVIHGHHIYKCIWQPLVLEVLTLEWEEGIPNDTFTVTLLKGAVVIGHVPREFSQVFWHFSGIIACEVTDVPLSLPDKATSQC